MGRVLNGFASTWPYLLSMLLHRCRAILLRWNIHTLVFLMVAMVVMLCSWGRNCMWICCRSVNGRPVFCFKYFISLHMFYSFVYCFFFFSCAFFFVEPKIFIEKEEIFTYSDPRHVYKWLMLVLLPSVPFTCSGTPVQWNQRTCLWRSLCTKSLRTTPRTLPTSGYAEMITSVSKSELSSGGCPLLCLTLLTVMSIDIDC